VQWIREETRANSIATALAWLVQGKAMNWKYVNCQVA
jgi:hypothetical protein